MPESLIPSELRLLPAPLRAAEPTLVASSSTSSGSRRCVISLTLSPHPAVHRLLQRCSAWQALPRRRRWSCYTRHGGISKRTARARVDFVRRGGWLALFLLDSSSQESGLLDLLDLLHDIRHCRPRAGILTATVYAELQKSHHALLFAILLLLFSELNVESLCHPLLGYNGTHPPWQIYSLLILRLASEKLQQ